jgi:DnaJ family protein C protein 19
MSHFLFFNFCITHTYATNTGGFEDKMTRKEAALILGVRESSTPKRIKEAHRKLLILNHPDTGGSTFIAGKVNEAKELLLKGKKH